MHTLTLLLSSLAAVSTSSSGNLLAPRKYCGYQHTDDYHNKNTQIQIDEFPWIAQLLYDEDKSVKCTGSLINNRYVLTAAHCISSRGTYLSGVRLGDFNVTSDRDCVTNTEFGKECSDPIQEFNTEKEIIHPNYRPITSTNDIGLIRLSRNVQFSDYIRPICLPLSTELKLNEGEELSTSGWGLLDYLGTPTEIKKKVITTLISIEDCKKLYQNGKKSVTDANLCAMENETYTCQGDGGGPLMRSTKNQWEQVGILLFGKQCGFMFPSVYVNIAFYIDWIKENLRT